MASRGLNTVSATAGDLGPQVAEQVERDGYAIIRDVLDEGTCTALIDEIAQIERDQGVAFGANDFEGFHTRRIFNLIARGPGFRDLVTNETVTSAVEAILGDGFLLSGTTSMHIGPKETEQMLHADDGMISLPRPHPATMVTDPVGALRIHQGQRRDPTRPGFAPPGRDTAGDRGRTRRRLRRDGARQCPRASRLDLARRRTQQHGGRRALWPLDPVRRRLVADSNRT